MTESPQSSLSEFIKKSQIVEICHMVLFKSLFFSYFKLAPKVDVNLHEFSLAGGGIC